MLVQPLVALARHGQVGTRQAGMVRRSDAAQAERGTAFVRTDDEIQVRIVGRYGMEAARRMWT